MIANNIKELRISFLLSPGDLARRIRERGACEPLAAARLGAQLAEGLAHVHALGVLHRDQHEIGVRESLLLSSMYIAVA